MARQAAAPSTVWFAPPVTGAPMNPLPSSLKAAMPVAFAATWILVSPLVVIETFPRGWHVLGVLGPATAALVVTAAVGGRPALAEFAGRILRWRCLS